MKLNGKILLFLLFAIVSKIRAQKQPNVLILYVDDLGYGDLSCYGAKAIQTPHTDWLAKNGLKFTDAHCTASTCTPSRYSFFLVDMLGVKRGQIFCLEMLILLFLQISLPYQRFLSKLAFIQG